MHDFRYVGNQLFCEGVSVGALARKFGTPLYVYSQHTLTDHFQKLDRALAPVEHLICFSLKSNGNLSVLRTLANLGSGFDIVSGGELQRVIAAGGDPRQCVFAGVAKTEAEIEFALRRGVYSFNAESEPELARINRVAARLKKIAPIAVRVNPNVEAFTHAKITTGTYENKFGIAFEQVEAVYARARRFKARLKPRGSRVIERFHQIEQRTGAARCNIKDLADRFVTFARQQIGAHDIAHVDKVAGLQAIAINDR